MEMQAQILAEKRKDLGRRLFYDCARRWISRERFKNSRALLLLGDSARELPYLDTFFRREQVVCIEESQSSFLNLAARNLRIAMYQDDLDDFLRWAIPAGYDFSIMNLDIYGTYRNTLRKSFCPLLYLAYRESEHIIGFTSSIGRDSKLLCEAIVAAALLAWHGEELVRHVAHKRCTQFHQVGEFQSSENLVLRDLLWIRDVLEHSLLLSTTVLQRYKLYRQYHTCAVRLSKAVVNELQLWHRRNFSLQVIFDIVRKVTHQSPLYARLSREPCVVLGLRRMVNFLYHSTPPWLMRQYFVQFTALREPLPLGEAAQQILTLYEQSFFQYATRDGQATQLPAGTAIGRISISLPRRFADFSPEFNPIILKLPTSGKEMRRLPMAKSSRHVSLPTPSTPKSVPLVNGEGKLTKYGAAVARELFEEGKTSKEVALDLGCKETSARAVLAHMNR